LIGLNEICKKGYELNQKIEKKKGKEIEKE
jgi:hypothetical protein